MKKNEHKDELDDFLERNLSSYSENPPDDLWNAIEAGLPQGERSTTTHLWSNRRIWYVAAVAATLICLLTCQHFYYNQRLESLREQFQQQVENQTRHHQPAVPTVPLSETVHPETAGVTAPDLTEYTLPSNPNTPYPAQADHADRTLHTSLSAITLPAYSNPELTSGTIPPPTVEPADVQKGNTSSLLQMEEAGQYKSITEIAFLPGISPMVRTSALALSPTVKPVFPPTDKGKWTVYAHTSFLNGKATVKSIRAQPGPGGPKTFREDRSAEGRVIMAGAGVERKINRHVSLLSGVDFQQSALTAEHKAELKFGDRMPPHQGGPHFNHGFSYQVNTSSGPLKVDVRMSEVDSSVQIPDQEDLGLIITRRETTQYLTVPLVAKAGIGYKRFRFYAKAGLLTDILLRHENSITGITSLNPRLRIEPGTTPQASNTGLRPVSLSYLAATGLEVGVTPRIAIQLEPTLTGGLTSRQRNSEIRVNRMATGINAGVSFKF